MFNRIVSVKQRDENNWLCKQNINIKQNYQQYGLVSLFNGISTLFRLFNVKAILIEEQQWYYLTHSWEDKGVHTFPKCIFPKVNIGLVSLFNGISTLNRLFNAKDILLEEQQWYYLTHSWEDKGVHTFPKGICPKVNVIARLEYELAYYDSAVHRFNHYTTKTPPIISRR